MLACPRCRKRLAHVHEERGVTWACPGRDGRALHLSHLRRSVPDEVIDRLDRDAQYATRRSGPPCPSCARSMVPIPLKVGSRAVPVDVCPRCRIAWFDREELEALQRRAAPPPPPVAAKKKGTPPSLPRPSPPPLRHPAQTPSGTSGDLAWPHFLPALLGFPIELDAPARARLPVATWTIVGIVTLVSLLAMARPDHGFAYAFLPSQPWRHSGWTFLSSFFLHGGVLHLAGNMYFLWIFGDNVEDHLRPPRYVLLLALATIVGNVVHAATTTLPDVPCVGASGGISGVIAYYALAFPQVRIGVLVRFFWLHLTARTAFFVWVGLQTLFAIANEGQVSYVAHLGGAAVGLAFWLMERPSSRSAEARRIT